MLIKDFKEALKQRKK